MDEGWALGIVFILTYGIVSIFSLDIRYNKSCQGRSAQGCATGNRCVLCFGHFMTLCLISQPMKWGANGDVLDKWVCLQQRRLGTNGEESCKSFRNGDRGRVGYPGLPRIDLWGGAGAVGTERAHRRESHVIAVIGRAIGTSRAICRRTGRKDTEGL